LRHSYSAVADTLARWWRVAEAPDLRPSSDSLISIRDGWAGQDVARTGDVRGIEAVLVGKGEQEFLVVQQVVEDAKQEIRLAGGGAARFRSDAGGGENPAEPFRLARDEAE